MRVAPSAPADPAPARALLRSTVIGLTAFLTVVDLFATQALLPALTQAYRVTPAAMSFAVNADTAGAFAAYITGNVASNLFGRLFAAALADHVGLAGNFYVFALLNLCGAMLVYFTVARADPAPAMPEPATPPFAVWAVHVCNPALRASFAIGFAILFAFIGTFTFVNFVLAREPLALSQMQRGFVYLVFLPSILTTPLAGRAVARIGARATFRAAIVVACAGLPLLVTAQLWAVLAGLALVAIGTFLAQAVATGFVGRAATTERAAASGLYLAS
jgi:YNFM family putative membrane transporter